jgi:polyribonucleotide nucleotidyltransferase
LKVVIRVERQIGSGVLSLETGLLAKQAAAAVICQYNDTVVLNAVASGPGRPGIDFFPLTCDYRERAAAAGKFPGGFLKREGRPSTKETLTSRLMDRPIRPLFPKGFVAEVQCQSFVMSSDRQTDGDILAMIGTAAALFISPLPFDGPIASIRVGRIDGQFIPFPSADELETSDLDLIVSGGDHAVTMIEGFAQEMAEAEMLAAIDYAHGVIREIIDLQRELASKVNVTKQVYVAPADDGLDGRLSAAYFEKLKTAKQTVGKQDRAEANRTLKAAAIAEFIPEPAAADAICSKRFSTAWHDLEEKVVRSLILSGTRADGRDSKSLRQIDCYVDVLPRVHGSAVFQRGETQALMTVTLGTSRDEQRVDGLQNEYSKKFMLDYNFPSFSVGECKPIRGPGRREIGHGMLAERSVKPILPDPEVFPYTIRVISDILESNGSSSMASVCGSTLALMAAGVPILNPVAGISVGLVKEGSEWTLLTDILGDEDHFGDMDFKIAGTQNGITGIQLDLKINGIDREIIAATLIQSREARIEILKKMLMTISRPKADISETAPRLVSIKIDTDKIGALIGPGGKTIRSIQEQTGSVIEVDDTGKVTLASGDKAKLDQARAMVEAVTATVQVGRLYKGTVASIRDFGVFVEILPGRDGLCHVSELAEGFIRNIGEHFRVGEEMQVLVIGIDDQDRIKLSRRAALKELGLADELAAAIGDAGRPEGGDSPRSDRGRGDSNRGQGGQRGREGRGPDDRGGESRGSESRGSESRGSESRGSESRGGEGRGGEGRGRSDQRRGAEPVRSEGGRSEGGRSEGGRGEGGRGEGRGGVERGRGAAPIADGRGGRPPMPKSVPAPGPAASEFDDEFEDDELVDGEFEDEAFDEFEDDVVEPADDFDRGERPAEGGGGGRRGFSGGGGGYSGSGGGGYSSGGGRTPRGGQQGGGNRGRRSGGGGGGGGRDRGPQGGGGGRRY